eukprot:6191342-Pleurochrysis_carterae.AAC.5
MAIKYVYHISLYGTFKHDKPPLGRAASSLLNARYWRSCFLSLSPWSWAHSFHQTLNPGISCARALALVAAALDARVLRRLTEGGVELSCYIVNPCFGCPVGVLHSRASSFMIPFSTGPTILGIARRFLGPKIV